MAAPKVSGGAFGGGETRKGLKKGPAPLYASLDRAEHPGRSTTAVNDAGDWITPVQPRAPPGRLRILLNELEILQGPDRSVPCRDRARWSHHSQHYNPSFCASHCRRIRLHQCFRKQCTKLCT